MSKGYADFMNTQSGNTGSTRPSVGLANDWSRTVLFVIVGLAALAGYWYTSSANKPQRVIRASVSKTVAAPFTASIGGNTTLADSLIAAYRSRESYVPGRGISVLPMRESAPAPFNSLQALEMLRNAAHLTELGREDMYSHATRHFSGELANVPAGANLPRGCYFEYWADMRNLSAVRLTMTGVRRDAAVDSLGESLSAVTSITIRYIDASGK